MSEQKTVFWTWCKRNVHFFQIRSIANNIVAGIAPRTTLFSASTRRYNRVSNLLCEPGPSISSDLSGLAYSRGTSNFRYLSAQANARRSWKSFNAGDTSSEKNVLSEVAEQDIVFRGDSTSGVNSSLADAPTPESLSTSNFQTLVVSLSPVSTMTMGDWKYSPTEKSCTLIQVDDIEGELYLSLKFFYIN